MTDVIDFGLLTADGEIHNLSGHERGLNARDLYKLDRLDMTSEPVKVVVSEDLYAMSPSFFQGMFAKSVHRLGSRDKFLEHYLFDATPDFMEDVDRGIRAVLTNRNAVFSR